MTDTLAIWLGELLGASPELIRRLLDTLLVAAAYAVGRRVIVRLIGRRFEDTATRYRFSKGTQVVLATIAAAALFRVWFQDASGIGTWLGLVSAGVAVALQTPLENLAGWVYLVSRRPFHVGDRIQIGEHAGDVVDIHLFTFTMLEIGNWVDADQSTGRVLHVPNGWLFKHSVAGYDQGFPYIWNEIPVVITFESDWRIAKSALERVLAEHAGPVDAHAFDRASEVGSIQYARRTPVVWVERAPDGIRLTMRYLCPPRERRVSTSRMWEAVFDAFAELDRVELAYPTIRRVDRAVEPKAGRRGASAEADHAEADHSDST